MLIGYLEGIFFERQLMRQIQVNLSFRRFIGYEIDEEIPDHSTLSKARDRFDLEFHYAAFSGIVRQCEEAEDCLKCPMRRECCSSERGRIVSRSMDEEYVLAARERSATPAGRKAARMRRSTVEWSFGEGKMYHNLRRAQWRGIRKAAIQNILEATAQNVKRLVEAHDMRNKAAAAAAARQLLYALEAANMLYRRLMEGAWRMIHGFLPIKVASRPCHVMIRLEVT